MAPGNGKQYDKHVNFSTDVEKGIPAKQAIPLSVTKRIAEVNVDINRLKESVDELRNLYVEGKECINERQKQTHQLKVQEYATRVKNQASSVIKDVKRLQQQNKEVELQAQEALKNEDFERLKVLVNNNANSINSRRQRISALFNELSEIEKDVQEVEDNFKLERRQMVEAQLEDALDRDVSEEEVERVMETPGALQKILTDSMISRSGVVLDDTLNQLQVRLNTAQQLEKDALAIASMFLEMKTMLAQQGEQISIITKDIEQALSHQKTGNVHLEKAVVHQGTMNKTRIGILMLVAAAVAALVLLLLFGSII